jgi:tRNA pseudouridine55 synthase
LTQPRRRRPDDTFNGFLNVCKPLGVTSFDVIARLRKIFGVRRMGHAGTLDPAATGVLAVAIGRATRLLEYLEHDKCYRARVRLGVSTTTLDADGAIVEERPVPPVTADEVAGRLRGFVGWQDQVPPMASAIHHEGRRLHELFRAGKTVELPPRRVRIDALGLLGLELPCLDLEMRCGAGTYVRSLARDLGEALGCGAHVQSLERTVSGSFVLEQATRLEDLEDAADDELRLQGMLLPGRVALSHLVHRVLDAERGLRLRQGLTVRLTPAEDAQLSRELADRSAAEEARRDPQQAAPLAPAPPPVLILSPEGETLAVALYLGEALLRPHKVLAVP